MVGTGIKLHSYIELHRVSVRNNNIYMRALTRKEKGNDSVKKTAHEMELKSVQTTLSNKPMRVPDR